MKIVISGSAQAYDRDSEELIADPARLSQLDGLSYSDDVCGDYLNEPLYEIGIIGGQVELSYLEEESQLRVLTSYHAPRKLKKAEIQALVAETTAQWSDGIGEGEFLHAEEFGIDVDISSFDATPDVEQFDDGIVVRKPKKSELVKLLESQRADEDAAIDLVKRGAAIDAKNRYGKSVLELACRAVLPGLVALLLKRGALQKTDVGNGALSMLPYCRGTGHVLENSVEIAKQLVEAGVTVDGTDENGHTPLMMAANRNNLPLVKFLLSVGADVNRQQADEDNQLSVLMFAQHPEMVEYLLENGADPNICSAYGMNAYEVQMQNSHQRNYKKMAEMIQRHLK